VSHAGAPWQGALPALAGLLLAACDGGARHDDRLSRAPLTVRLAHADAARGGQQFARCVGCHNDGETAGDRDGPNLWGVVDQPLGHNRPAFAYSAALQAKGGVWTCARLDAWLTSPHRFAPGTIMAFPGLADGADRADVIAYLVAHGPAGRRCG
jgi:cytochrome c